MTDAVWHALQVELDLWLAQGLSARLWLRDDDAIAPTPALDQLIALARRWRAPVLVAVIPAMAEPALARRLADEPLLTPCQHGYAHTNHAEPGEKKCELGPHRPIAAVLADLQTGHARLQSLFGERLAPVLVPPWNRIAPSLLPELPALGYSALSTFGPARGVLLPALAQINCDLDIINWHGGRGGVDAAVLTPRLTALLALARAQGGGPVGILTHHLVHDAVAWHWLETVLEKTCCHPAASWLSGAELHKQI